VATVFVQQTVSPWLIVGLSGVNEKFAIEIRVSPAWQVVPVGPAPAARVEACPAAGKTSSKANNTSVENPLPIPMAGTILPSRAGFQDRAQERPSRSLTS
jgi:hypothetical protein